MKQITNKTILKQGDKTYQPIEFGGMITWCDEHEGTLAQSEPKLTDIPVVSLDSYSYMIAQSWEETFNSAFYDSKINVGNIAKDCVLFGFNSNPNQYTQADIERALSLAFLASQDGYDITTKEILEQINSISVIEVDEDFNVINFE
jgi:hypothetical protein